MIAVLSKQLELEYTNLNLWYFVSFITGIVVYFSLVFEPSLSSIVIFFCGSLSLLYFRNYGIISRFLIWLVISFACGMLVSKYRVMHLQVHTIEKPVVNEVNGIIESIKPTTRGIQAVVKQDDANRVRIHIPEKYKNGLFIGDTIKVPAKLYRPQGSILPGGYNFGFYAWFAGITAGGYALGAPLITAQARVSTDEVIYKIRKTVYDRLIASLGKRQGNFAAAILLGETKGIDQKLMKNMRQSGISHILCVSGLHLSLVAMIFFITIRFMLNLSDFIAFNFNIKLIAAIGSLIGSYAYLELSGMQIAATRAFIMTTIFIISIIIERSPYPLRSIAIAAVFILTLNPEYIFHPSFQLSFIAVLSLISGYEFYLKNKWLLGNSGGIFAALKFYLASNIYSSFLASIVTAPVVINQFYIFSTYSVPMNLIAVPIMSFFLMPLSIIALGLMPFGIEGIILGVLKFFIDIIISSVESVNNLPGAVWYFGYITPLSLIIFLLGFFWICLWQTKWRLFGLGIMAVSFILMFNSPKPDFIFDVKLNAVGLKNRSGKLEIYAQKMPTFSRQYWANWFGQKDATVLYEKSRVFTVQQGKTIAVNYSNRKCRIADIQINLNGSSCKAKEFAIDQEILQNSGTVILFCSDKKCRVKYDNNKRFNTGSPN